MQKPIFKYSENIRKSIHSKTEVQPWLHFVTVRDKYAIYVWDTRQIVETGTCNSERAILASNFIYANDNNKPLVGNDSKIFNDLLFTKFDVKVERGDNGYRGSWVKYYLNGRCICTTRTYKEKFCRVGRDGRPSRLREVTKTAHETMWDANELCEIFGKDARGIISEVCKCGYPDLRYGDPGFAISKSSVIEHLQTIKSKITKS